jgi:hypothetical protein
MISADLSAIIKELQQHVIDTRRRLENVVAGFAYEFVLALGENTPMGSQWALDNNKKYHWFYEQRNFNYGIPMEVGYHQSQWKVSASPHIDFDTMVTSIKDSANHAQYTASQYFTLGNTFYIGHNTPGMEALDGGYSKQAPGINSITTPSLTQVMQAYQIDVVKYYNGYSS